MTRRHIRLRAVGLALLLGLGLHALATPRPVQADNCTIITLDLCAWSDSVSVTYVQTPLMELLWDANRRALLLARWLEGLHDWLAQGVLATALDVVLGAVRLPFWLAAAVAVVVFVATYLAQVLLVRAPLVQLGRALGVVLLASLLFRTGLPALAAVEHLRLALVSGFGDIAQGLTTAVSAPLFYVPDDGSAAPPHPIYTADVCGLAVKRAVLGVHISDLTANFLWADAEDIHCASGSTSLPDLPRAFMRGDGEKFAGYLPSYPLNETDSAERARLLAAANDGTNRLLTALVALAPAAVLEPLWSLLLLLALATIALAFLVALPAGLFAPLAHLLQRQARGLVDVFVASGLSSFWLGVVSGLLRLAAQSGNANAVAVAGVLAALVLVWQCGQAALLAGRTLSIGAGAVGVSIGELGRAGRGTVQALGQGALSGGLLAAAAATGGAGALAGQMLRRGLLTAGGGAASRAAGQHLAHELERWAGDDRSYGEERQRADQVAWYARRREAEGRQERYPHEAAAERDLLSREVRRLEHQAAQARARGAFGQAERLEAAIAQRRAALGGQGLSSAPAPRPATPADPQAPHATARSSSGAAPARARTPDHQAARRRRIAALRARQVSGGVR